MPVWITLPPAAFAGSWLDSPCAHALARVVIPAWLQPADAQPAPRWYPRADGSLRSVSLRDEFILSHRPERRLILADLVRGSAAPATIALPLALLSGKNARLFESRFPWAVRARFDDPLNSILIDAMAEEAACEALRCLIAQQRTVPGAAGGTLLAQQSARWTEIAGADANPDLLAPRVGEVEQTNASAWFGNRLYFKLFRTLTPGINPELELGRFLTDNAACPHIPRLAGSLEYLPPSGGEPWTLAIAQEQIPAPATAWDHAVNLLSRDWSPRDDSCQPPLWGALGDTLANLHAALARFTPPDSNAARIEPLTPAACASTLSATQRLAARVLPLLSEWAGQHAGSASVTPAEIRHATSALEKIQSDAMPLPHDQLGSAFRVHGDLHLGQVLHADHRFLIIDFEGEPLRPLADRRALASPLRDVAGMLRSFDYAAGMALLKHAHSTGPDTPPTPSHIHARAHALAKAFLDHYLSAAADATWLPRGDAFQSLLQLELSRKLVYELLYELEHRPDWVPIPLRALASASITRI
jgi:trehalose synthase-fused probable maltokinase